MTHRLDWIDFARGIAIFSVVVVHAGRGISNAGVSDAYNLLSLIDATIISFAMPLFFIVSGITFGMRPPANIQPALVRRVWRLFYVMTIWTYAFLVLRAISGDYSNARGAWIDVLVLPLPPFLHFWFLWALLLNIVVFSLLRFALQRVVSDRVFWTGALLIALVVHFTVTLPPPLKPYFSQAMSYSMAFVAGAALAVQPMLKGISGQPTYLIGVALCFMLVFASISFYFPISKVASGTIISLCLLPLFIAISAKFGTSRWTRAIVYLGLMSLPIYVMHTIFSAMLRIVLIQSGIDDLSVHLVFGIAIGVLGPLAVYLIAKRAGVLRLIGLA